MPSKNPNAPRVCCKKGKRKHANTHTNSLFRAGGVLGDGLGAFRDGVLGKLTGEDEADTESRQVSR